MDIDTLALEKFSIKKLKSLQRLVIENVIAAENEEGKRKQIILFPTGGGKSLCFLLPAVILNGLTIVIYPLLSLMADQKRRMDEAGINACVINGKTSNEEIDSYFSAIKSGKIKIAIINPEIIIKRNLIPRFKECKISHIAIDEAHCVTSWGNTFRPDYLKLGSFIKELNANCVSAFTATAPDYILKDIKKLLFDNEAFVIKGEGDRENIFYSVIKTSSKKDFLLELCKTEEKPLIIFCNTRANAEDIARDVAEDYGYETVRFYHAGLTNKEKQAVENWFFNSNSGILCATCAYGMGIDKANIRTVIHYNIPYTVESYVQEAGRVGRDKEKANAILLYDANDEKSLENESKTDEKKHIMYDYIKGNNCRRNFLLNALSYEKVKNCSGCDICNNTQHKDLYEKKALEFITRYRKCYTINEIINLFMKKYNWNIDTARTVLDNLLQDGKIKKLSFIWKNRLTISK